MTAYARQFRETWRPLRIPLRIARLRRSTAGGPCAGPLVPQADSHSGSAVALNRRSHSMPESLIVAAIFVPAALLAVTLYYLDRVRRREALYRWATAHGYRLLR